MPRGLKRCRYVVLGAATLLAACQTGDGQVKATPIPASESLIRLEHPDFMPELAEYAAHRNDRSGDESHIASFHGPEAQAIVVALRAGPDHVVEAASTEAWTARLLPDAELVWGESGRAASGQASYRFFRAGDAPLSCVAFSQSRSAPDDRLKRDAELLYGYFCRDELRPLTTEDAGELLSSVEIARSRQHAPAPDLRQPAAMDADAPIETDDATMAEEDLCEAVHREPLRVDLGNAIAERGLACHPAQLACTGIADPDPCVAAMTAQLAHDPAFDCFLGPVPKLPPYWAAQVVPDHLHAGFLAVFNQLFAEPRVHEPIEIYVHKLDSKVVGLGWTPYLVTFHRFCLRGFLPLSADEYQRLMGTTP